MGPDLPQGAALRVWLYQRHEAEEHYTSGLTNLILGSPTGEWIDAPREAARRIYEMGVDGNPLNLYARFKEGQELVDGLGKLFASEEKVLFLANALNQYNPVHVAAMLESGMENAVEKDNYAEAGKLSVEIVMLMVEVAAALGMVKAGSGKGVGKGGSAASMEAKGMPKEQAAPLEQYAVGRSIPPIERTMEHALSPEAYINDVVSKYGINLQGRGQSIRVEYDPGLGRGTGRLGVTRKAEGGRVVRVGPDAMASESILANTIAHELSHARDYLSGVHKPHGDAESLGDGTPYGSGNALDDYIRGGR